MLIQPFNQALASVIEAHYVNICSMRPQLQHRAIKRADGAEIPRVCGGQINDDLRGRMDEVKTVDELGRGREEDLTATGAAS